MSSNQTQPGRPPSQWHADRGPNGSVEPSAPAQKRGVWARFKGWAFSNLNLNGRTPPRVQPTIGEWGPEKVPTTKQKKRMRIYVGIALPLAMLACFLLGWYVYFLMTGCYGFGFGCRS